MERKTPILDQQSRAQGLSSRSLDRKLHILADAAKYDASCASSGSRRKGTKGELGNSSGVGICHSYTPDGRCVSLLKILLTNWCIYDCRFCVNRVSNDIERARFDVEEVVRLTLDFYGRNYIEGLFLSSGILKSADVTMERLVAVARTLRQKHRFNGYIHLKAVPGASPELLAQAGRWADRLSANVELATADDLAKLAPEKNLNTIEASMAEISVRVRSAREEQRRSRRAPKFAPAGQSTQMVVGATATPDREILSTAERLYSRHSLRRVYYSAYSPIASPDPRLPPTPPPLTREHRLYQADWLMRYYGFQAGDLTTDKEPSLASDIDPKLSWALRNRQEFPVDVNRAPFERLLRVPGIGRTGARRIVTARRHRMLRIDDLRRLKVMSRRALPFVITADSNPYLGRLDSASLPERLRARERQLSLFEAKVSSVTGQL